jgi:hypothetical protein
MATHRKRGKGDDDEDGSRKKYACPLCHHRDTQPADFAQHVLGHANMLFTVCGTCGVRKRGGLGVAEWRMSGRHQCIKEGQAPNLYEFRPRADSLVTTLLDVFGVIPSHIPAPFQPPQAPAAVMEQAGGHVPGEQVGAPDGALVPGGQPTVPEPEPVPEGGEPVPEGGDPEPEGGDPEPEGGDPEPEGGDPHTRVIPWGSIPDDFSVANWSIRGVKRYPLTAEEEALPDISPQVQIYNLASLASLYQGEDGPCTRILAKHKRWGHLALLVYPGKVNPGLFFRDLINWRPVRPPPHGSEMDELVMVEHLAGRAVYNDSSTSSSSDTHSD